MNWNFRSTGASTSIAKYTGNVARRSELIEKTEDKNILPSKDKNRNKFAGKKYEQTLSSQTYTGASSNSKSSNDLCTSKTKCPCNTDTKTSESNSKPPSPKIKKERFYPNFPNRRPLSKIIEGSKSEITIKNKEEDNDDDRKENSINKEFSNKDNSKNKATDSARQTSLSNNERNPQKCVQINPNCPTCNSPTINVSNNYECPNCSRSHQRFNIQENHVSIRRNKKTCETPYYSDASYSSNSESMLVVNYQNTVSTQDKKQNNYGSSADNENYPTIQDDEEWKNQPTYSVNCEENSSNEVVDEDYYKSFNEDLIFENSITHRIDNYQKSLYGNNKVSKTQSSKQSIITFDRKLSGDASKHELNLICTKQEQDSSMRIIGKSYNNDASIEEHKCVVPNRRNAYSKTLTADEINQFRLTTPIQSYKSSSKQINEKRYYNQGKYQ